MKKCGERKLFIVFLIGIIYVSALYSRDGEFTKEYNEVFETNNNTSLFIDNKYGNVDINNWEENKISIKIIIKVRAANKERADELFNNADISISKEGDRVMAITDFSEDFGSFKNDLIEIKYTVNMPSDIPLDLSNKYGNVFIDELTSTSTINLKYGNLKANKILHSNKEPYTQIILGYSNANIQSCTWAKIDIKYSNLDINSSKALIILSKYSKIFIEKGTSVVAESKYDTYRFGKISNIVASAGYSNFKAEEVSNKIKMETKYTDMNVNFVPADFESISINSSYGNYKILVDQSASYMIDGYAKYAKILVPENSDISRFNENNEFKVNGLVGENKGTKSKISVHSNYGSIKFVE